MNFIYGFIACLALMVSCKKSSQGSNLPAAAIESSTAERAVTSSNLVFKVTLNKAASSDVTLQYNTIAGTALENKDFTPATGTLTFASGQTSTTLPITITGDSLRKSNQQFSIHISDPKNCTINTTDAIGTIINENGLYFPVNNTGYTTPAQYPGYTLAWSDEFTGNAVNSNNWSYELGNSGWGNNELENYTSSTKNSFVSGGNLIIEARQEQLANSNYTSARMTTKGKQAFKFGRIDIRAILPKGKGIWPALWLLGTDIDMINWPACGEIDMMELLGQNPDKIYGTLHWGADYTTAMSKGTNYVLTNGSFDQQFHVYSMNWKQDSIQLLIDDIPFFSASGSDITGNNPFNASFYFLLNVAVGGDWPGSPDGSTAFPQRIIVDYIRVFQQ